MFFFKSKYVLKCCERWHKSIKINQYNIYIYIYIIQVKKVINANLKEDFLRAVHKVVVERWGGVSK